VLPYGKIVTTAQAAPSIGSIEEISIDRNQEVGGVNHFRIVDEASGKTYIFDARGAGCGL
jgi:hypothetical protein